MNGKTAKRLRKIARSLQLAPATSYHPLQGQKVRIREDKAGNTVEVTLTQCMDPCFRRANKEAKKLYKGVT